MLWGRSGYAGSHTIPAAWAGDSSTHLNNHACILRGGLSASMSGIPFWGFDMGGFYNTDHEGYECVPTDEEYIRSCQFGFFNSLSRCHGKTPREPWNFGEKAEKIFKKFNDIRHLLLPYLYSTTYKTHLSDIPVIRPVVMEYPEDRSARNVELEYFLGDSLLVVPVFDQEDEIDVYLPNGQWIDLFTHERIKGGRWVKRKIELDKIPVFIRQNKMIPMLTKIPENIEEKYENLDVILTYATENKFGVAAINTLNIETVKYVIEAAERERVPIIVQFYPGFSDYTDLKHLAFAACDMAEKASIPVGVHLDHSVTYEIAVGGIRDGFPSVMIDGSTKSFQENVELTKNVVRVAKVFGVDVEAELGHVGNGDSIDAIDNTNYYTKVEDAVRFVEQTGCDSLAIAVGNAHGPYVKTPNLDLERIYAIRKKVNIPLVLHGCSDIPEEQMKEAVNLGMSKFNIATEYFRTMYQSIEKRINNQEFEGNGVKLMYDIKEEMIDFVIQKIRLLNPNKYSM